MSKLQKYGDPKEKTSDAPKIVTTVKNGVRVLSYVGPDETLIEKETGV